MEGGGRRTHEYRDVYEETVKETTNQNNLTSRGGTYLQGVNEIF